jgi:hypothetical protein
MANRNLRTPTTLDEFTVWLTAKADIGDCWTWARGTYESGYGQCWAGYGPMRAHVFVWLWLVGPIEPGLQLDHLCRNILCVSRPRGEPPDEGSVRALVAGYRLARRP